MRMEKMSSLVFTLVGVFLLSICAPLQLQAQIDAAGITGTVMDSTGARIPGALITLYF